MDLCDDPENARVIAMLEVPGMKMEQLSVQVDGGHLIVEGEHIDLHAPARAQTPKPSASGELKASKVSSPYVRELKYGKVKREIELPVGLDVRPPFNVWRPMLMSAW